MSLMEVTGEGGIGGAGTEQANVVTLLGKIAAGFRNVTIYKWKEGSKRFCNFNLISLSINWL